MRSAKVSQSTTFWCAIQPASMPAGNRASRRRRRLRRPVAGRRPCPRALCAPRCGAFGEGDHRHGVPATKGGARQPLAHTTPRLQWRVRDVRRVAPRRLRCRPANRRWRGRWRLRHFSGDQGSQWAGMGFRRRAPRCPSASMLAPTFGDVRDQVGGWRSAAKGGGCATFRRPKPRPVAEGDHALGRSVRPAAARSAKATIGMGFRRHKAALGSHWRVQGGAA